MLILVRYLGRYSRSFVPARVRVGVMVVRSRRLQWSSLLMERLAGGLVVSSDCSEKIGCLLRYRCRIVVMMVSCVHDHPSGAAVLYTCLTGLIRCGRMILHGGGMRNV
jgi:hypothetical protein